MTLGLCLIAAAHWGVSGPSPIWTQIPQTTPKKPPVKKDKQEKGGPSKPIVYPPAKPPAPPPEERFRNLALPNAQRVDALVDALTADERIAFLCVRQKAVARLHIPAFDWSSRSTDSQFPHPIGIGASFDVDLASRIATAVSSQGTAEAHFVPTAIVTDPRWGLAKESYGEDPLLTGSLAKASIASIRARGGIATAGILGDPGRTKPADTPKLPPDDLGPGFFPPIQSAISGDAYLGLWVDPLSRAADAPVFQPKTVRADWGLLGPVIDSRTTKPAPKPVPEVPAAPTAPKATRSQTNEAPPKKPAEESPKPTEKPPAVAALLGGCDLFSEEDVATIAAAKSDPEVAKAADLALRRILAAEIRAGMFQPKPPKIAPIPPDQIASLQSRAAQESIVILKNDGDLLPLKKSYKTVAIIGPNADSIAALLGSPAEPPPAEKPAPNKTAPDKAAPDKASPAKTQTDKPAADKPSAQKPPDIPPAKIQTTLEAIKKALGDKTTVLYEEGTGIIGREDLETIPATAFPNGLAAEIYDATDFSGIPVTQHDDHLDVSWHGSPPDGIKAKRFSAIWTGAVIPPAPGTYGIGVTVDGYARVYVDDHLVIDEWKDGPTRTRTVPIEYRADDGFVVVRVEYARGSGDGSLRLVWSPPRQEPYRDAIVAAIKSDLVILVLGLDPSLEGASIDRPTATLPDSQEGLLEQILQIHKPTILVLLNGGPLSIPTAKASAQAIVEAWYPGPSGASAIADVLTGVVNPSGKLPVTIYPSDAQLPSPSAPDADRGYRRSVYRPLFAFGSGLSYSKFAYSGLDMPKAFDPARPFIVGVNIRNTSNREGEEVVEVYISREKPQPYAPRIALRAFRRVHLNAGEGRRIVFPLSTADFQVVHRDLTAWLEPGPVSITVGGNQPIDGLPPTLSQTVRIPSPAEKLEPKPNH